jgi:S-sulfo-L-cysteine synthase (O-acetyl-L-serine-dependent)
MNVPGLHPIAIRSGLETAVGNTPLLPLRRLTSHLLPGVEVFAKAEWFNPGGSVKDRPALFIIRDALESGRLRPSVRLLDSTSGNMGIAYATLGAAMGVPVSLAIPSNASPERLQILRTLGAELFLTDPLEGSDGAIRFARQLALDRPDDFYYADQYDNPANWLAHYQTTGPEIFNQTAGGITHFVAGLGTTGTLMGNGRFLKEKDGAIEIIAFQPDSPFHGLEGLKHLPTAIQPGIFDPNFPDRTIEVGTEASQEMTRRLAREEGLFVGVSSGAAALTAIQIAERLERGIVVTVFPDAGYKYISQKFWEDHP